MQEPAKPRRRLSGVICFDHVSFAYEQKKVLRDVSVTVKGGTTLGVLGETGSGQEHHCAAAPRGSTIPAREPSPSAA